MDFVGAVIRNKIKELGQLWKSSENHVNVSIDVLNSWDTLISEWAEDDTGDKTKCERTKCECEASVTANQ